MKALLDTNIIIHREASRVVIKEIGVLFRWFDRLQYQKCVHQITLDEINKLGVGDTRDAITAKLGAYQALKTQAKQHPNVEAVSKKYDVNQNDINDSALLNEVYCDRVDILISEDKKIHRKAAELGLADRVFKIESFLEKVSAENPDLASYKVLAVQKELFGNISIDDDFFDSFKDDYPGFEKWFNRKSEEEAYICKIESRIAAFLYLKVEGKDENYSDIFPLFAPKKRLKIGTFKVTLNGYRLGERFLKVIFDNALRYRVDEIYVTIFDKRLDQKRLIDLLEEFGFVRHGIKNTVQGDELVYVRSMRKSYDPSQPKLTFPFFSKTARTFLVPIYPEYHTNLLPDSILRTESPNDFIENEPFRNAISKVYICRSIFRNLRSGDLIVFYRTGGLYKAVVTTIGIVENVVLNISSGDELIKQCRKRSVFSDDELRKHWDYSPRNRPFIVNFLYAYSFPKRPNLARLIELGVIKDVHSAPRGFESISTEHFEKILKEAQADESFTVD